MMAFSDEAQSFLYFQTKNACLDALNPTKRTHFPFKKVDPLSSWITYKGFSMCFWIYIDKVESEIVLNGERVCPTLFTLHSKQCGGVEAFFNGYDLYYRYIP